MIKDYRRGGLVISSLLIIPTVVIAASLGYCAGFNPIVIPNTGVATTTLLPNGPWTTVEDTGSGSLIMGSIAGQNGADLGWIVHNEGTQGLQVVYNQHK
jgi:hypothetical protein